ncbi:unnamed protein product [Parnassius apollo]|uniref:UDP-glucuronosyltransferase n=1 Tax=Parnassius apollo TaxID=110799 RepID=A0A8S3XP36_PARAO|nr:unnamed protein product [Parnassius apollo]
MELIKRGHEVTVITPYPYFKNDTAPKNLREIDIHDISYKIWNNFSLTVTGKEDDLMKQVPAFAKIVYDIFEQIMSVKDVQDLIYHKKRQFDLILLEAYFVPMLGFTQHFKAPTVLPLLMDKDLQQYLDTSQNGVIYFSFGTNVLPSALPQEKIKIFESVFSQLPYNVIWKWDSNEKSFKSENIKIFKWLPQSDLLRHPNVKLFITQGGLQSTDESITAGVPLIGIPMLGDQWYNTEKYVHHKIGIKLLLENLTENQLKNAIIEVIEDKSYRENIIRLRSFMQDQPQAPLDRAIWWIEYVLRHGGAKHLRSPAANMSWIEYYELELVLILLSSILIIIGLITFLIKYSISYASKYVKEKQL